MLKLVFIAAFVTLASASCDWPPRFWCTSKSIARQCEVELQCAEQFWVEESDVQPVRLELYFESLCPDSIRFIVQMLYPTWTKFLGTNIIELHSFPYGNAHEVKDSSGMWNFTCQHGPQECYGNLIENCVQKYTENDVMKFFPIIYCMEAADDPIKSAKMCVTKGGLDWTVINKCAMGPEGNALMHMTALATDKLNPNHTYVPWVTINGEHTEEIQQEAQKDLTKLLCDTYKGVKPGQCQKKSPKLDVTYMEL